MTYHPLSIEGAWRIEPLQHGDPRGVFLEFFQGLPFEAAAGHPFTLAQGNCSVSAAGVVRGVHYADVPPGQAKYVTCLVGAVLDVVVDLRVGSPTFGCWDTVLLDDTDRHAVYLSEGLGHAFCSLQDGSTVLYLCSEPYAPARERGVHPLDDTLAIDWPATGRDGRRLELSLSAKDERAPTLAQASAAGELPTCGAATTYRESLRAAARRARSAAR